ncbi:hypothetical protein D7231_35260, partial [Streptomyces klenkii]
MDNVPSPLELLRAARPEVTAVTPAEWLAETGGVLEAIPYRWLYWPDVLEVHGAAFVDLSGLGREAIAERIGQV